MKPIRALLPGFAVALLAAGAPSTPVAAAPVTYGCDEVVVIGRVRTLDYADLSSEDDLFGHGRYSMRLSVKRVLRGKEARRVLPVIGYAHGQMRDDKDFWLVLTPASDGGYIVRTANLTTIPYRLASECGAVSE